MKQTFVVFKPDTEEWVAQEAVTIFGIPMLIGDRFGPIPAFEAADTAAQLTNKQHEYTKVEWQAVRAQHIHPFGRWLHLVHDEFVKRSGLPKQDIPEWVIRNPCHWFEYYVTGDSPFETASDEFSYWND